MGGSILGSAALERVKSEPSVAFRLSYFGKEGDVNLNPLGLSDFWGLWFGCFLGMCSVIEQDRANTLHSYALKEWATPAKLNTCSGTSIYSILQPHKLNSWFCYLCLRNNFSHNFLLLSYPWAIQHHLEGKSHSCDLTTHLIQNYCRLLQKQFCAPHSCVATGFSSHHALLGSLHHSAPWFLVTECSVWIWP